MADPVNIEVQVKQAIPPEAAVRLRKAMVMFVLVVALSVILTVSYVAGRAMDRPGMAGSAGRAAAAVTAPPNSGAAAPAPAPALPTEPVLEKPAPPQPVETAAVESANASLPASAAVVADPPPAPASVAKLDEDPKPSIEKKGELAARPEPKEAAAQPEPKNEEPAQPVESLAAPRRGLYLQVAASDKQGASTIAKAVGKTGIEAVSLPGPAENVFRVVAGPFSSNEDLSKARATLEASGYRPFPRRF